MPKITVVRREEVEVTHLLAECDVRYWEDAEVNGVEDEDGTLIPCRVGDCWRPQIEISTGRITNWNKGTIAKIHYKFCDAGAYTLLNDGGEVVMKDGYVPGMMCPKDNGYGDYIIMSVDENGYIDGWDDDPDLSYFEEEEDY